MAFLCLFWSQLKFEAWHMGKIWTKFVNKPLVSIFGLLIGEVLSFVACLTSSGRFSKRSKKDLFGLGFEAMPFLKSYCRPLNPNYLGLMIKWINNTIIALVWSSFLWQLSDQVLSWLEFHLKHIVQKSIRSKKNRASDNEGTFHSILMCRIWIYSKKFIS